MQIFTENLPVIGEVSMVFYVPPSSEERKIRDLIESHGGLVSHLHESFTYQIAPFDDSDKVNMMQYFWGDIYRADWLVESIRAGELLPRKKYHAFFNRTEGCKRILLKRNVFFTIREGLKVMEIAFKNESKM